MRNALELRRDSIAPHPPFLVIIGVTLNWLNGNGTHTRSSGPHDEIPTYQALGALFRHCKLTENVSILRI